jgi:hypothetical protein
VPWKTRRAIRTTTIPARITTGRNKPAVAGNGEHKQNRRDVRISAYVPFVCLSLRLGRHEGNARKIPLEMGGQPRMTTVTAAARIVARVAVI